MNIPKKKSIHLNQNSFEERTSENIKKKKKKLKMKNQTKVYSKKKVKKGEESEKLGRISRAFNFHFL